MQNITDNWLDSSTTKNMSEIAMLHKMNISKKYGSTFKKKKHKTIWTQSRGQLNEHSNNLVSGTNTYFQMHLILTKQAATYYDKFHFKHVSKTLSHNYLG